MSLNAFTEIYAMTRDGTPTVSPTLPVFGQVTVGASRISGFYLFQEFELGHYGTAAAISYILLVVAVVVSIVNVKILQPRKVK
jgi:ABC-type sugar transport system permease subunit